MSEFEPDLEEAVYDETEIDADPDGGIEDADDQEQDGDDADHLGQLPAGEDEGQEDRPAEVEQPRRSRAQERIEALTRERAAAAEQAAALQAKLDAIERAEAERQEQAKIQEMGPYEREQYLKDRQIQQLQAEFHQLRMQTAEAQDRAAFSALVATKPALSKYEAKVEESLAALRQNGQTAPRETILAYLIGQEMLAKAGTAKAKAARTAQGNKASQASRPTGGRSDTSSGASRNLDPQAARRARLEGLVF